jgi:hypothetical protein
VSSLHLTRHTHLLGFVSRPLLGAPSASLGSEKIGRQVELRLLKEFMGAGRLDEVVSGGVR